MRATLYYDVVLFFDTGAVVFCVLTFLLQMQKKMEIKVEAPVSYLLLQLGVLRTR